MGSKSVNHGASIPHPGPVVSVNEALLAFASMDHSSILGLGDLDIKGDQELCAFTGSEGTPEGVEVDAMGDLVAGSNVDDLVGDGDGGVGGDGGISNVIQGVSDDVVSEELVWRLLVRLVVVMADMLVLMRKMVIVLVEKVLLHRVLPLLGREKIYLLSYCLDISWACLG